MPTINTVSDEVGATSGLINEWNPTAAGWYNTGVNAYSQLPWFALGAAGNVAKDARAASDAVGETADAARALTSAGDRATMGEYWPGVKGEGAYDFPIHANQRTWRYGQADEIPSGANAAYSRYDATGWKGNYSGQALKTKAGKIYQNNTGILPKTNKAGQSITYREYDINPPMPNGKRDAERFIYGNDGSVYYTDAHYGDARSMNGLPPFIRIK